MGVSTKIGCHDQLHCQVVIMLSIQGRVAQSVTCLATDPGVASTIPARSHTFVEIDHEIISTIILLPSAESFKKAGLLSVTSESMCMKNWLTAC